MRTSLIQKSGSTWLSTSRLVLLLLALLRWSSNHLLLCLIHYFTMPLRRYCHLIYFTRLSPDTAASLLTFALTSTLPDLPLFYLRCCIWRMSL
ncbi:uncharacterized protein BDV14DRAFT_90913 [Aspergillus stella-maris]|uniref:uncharacterized protein n=1 Tax=Aspergillus stella-maris TaxID=1810926 RepID=UPI003CCD13D0